MKQAKSFSVSFHQGRAAVLIVALAAAVTTIACSSNSKPAAKPSQPVSATLRPASMHTVTPAAEPADLPSAAKAQVVPNRPASKLLTYKSRDYGVAFSYPWQYAFLNAKMIANADESLLPKSDGQDGQFTLARVDIPAGFYPGTDFESGYLTLSLNQGIEQKACELSLQASDASKVQKEMINGVEFQWVENDTIGGGNSSKIRNYVSYANDSCYEIELGVKTHNENGLAREVNPDQIMRRLDSMLKSVKIGDTVKAVTVESETASADLTN